MDTTMELISKALEQVVEQKVAEKATTMNAESIIAYFQQVKDASNEYEDRADFAVLMRTIQNWIVDNAYGTFEMACESNSMENVGNMIEVFNNACNDYRIEKDDVSNSLENIACELNEKSERISELEDILDDINYAMNRR